MCYTCIIAFTGGLVGSEIIYLWLDPVIQSSNPVQRSSPQSSPVIRDGQKLAIVQFIKRYIWRHTTVIMLVISDMFSITEVFSNRCKKKKIKKISVVL